MSSACILTRETPSKAVSRLGLQTTPSSAAGIASCDRLTPDEPSSVWFGGAHAAEGGRGLLRGNISHLACSRSHSNERNLQRSSTSAAPGSLDGSGTPSSTWRGAARAREPGYGSKRRQDAEAPRTCSESRPGGPRRTSGDGHGQPRATGDGQRRLGTG